MAAYRTHCSRNHPMTGANVRVQPSGRRRCRACERQRVRNLEVTTEQRRRWKLKSKYGLTPEDYAALLLEQGGRCAICRQTPADDKRLAVDHDHRTGEVRGLLCGPCNWFVGLLEAEHSCLDAALAYLYTKGGRREHGD